MADLLSVPDAIDLTRAPHLRTVPLFAYGTIRPGQPLARNVNVTQDEPGWLLGYSLYAYPHGHFPFLVEGGGMVKGDLLWCKPDARLLETLLMEVRAGYDVSIVNVHTEHLTETVPALAFVYPYVPAGTQLVPSGDWEEVTPWATTPRILPT